jgi:hypothetical protein
MPMSRRVMKSCSHVCDNAPPIYSMKSSSQHCVFDITLGHIPQSRTGVRRQKIALMKIVCVSISETVLA